MLLLGLTGCTVSSALGQRSIHSVTEWPLATLGDEQGQCVLRLNFMQRCTLDPMLIRIREIVGHSDESGIQPAAFATTKRIPHGTRLQEMVMSRCEHIAYWNRPYEYNGIGDCYGYCRQVWNAILADGKEHTEDYYPHKYDKERWIYFKGGIPVNTFPDTNWVYFSSFKVLVPGDLLATDRGHFWGPEWHGGIYAGNGDDWDCSKHDGLNGAYLRRLFSGFHYYYHPLHELLLGNSSARIGSVLPAVKRQTSN